MGISAICSLLLALVFKKRGLMHTTHLTRPLRGRQEMASRSAAANIVESLEQRLLLATMTQIAPGFQMQSMQADPARDLVYILDGTNNRVLAFDTGLAKTASFA